MDPILDAMPASTNNHHNMLDDSDDKFSKLKLSSPASAASASNSVASPPPGLDPTDLSSIIFNIDDLNNPFNTSTTSNTCSTQQHLGQSTNSAAQQAQNDVNILNIANKLKTELITDTMLNSQRANQANQAAGADATGGNFFNLIDEEMIKYDSVQSGTGINLVNSSSDPKKFYLNDPLK